MTLENLKAWQVAAVAALVGVAVGAAGAAAQRATPWSVGDLRVGSVASR